MARYLTAIIEREGRPVRKAPNLRPKRLEGVGLLEAPRAVAMAGRTPPVALKG